MTLLDTLLTAILPLTQTYVKTVVVNQNVSSSAGPVQRTIEGDEPEHICIFAGIQSTTTLPAGAVPSFNPLIASDLFYPTEATFQVEFQQDITNQPLNVTFAAVFTPVG